MRKSMIALAALTIGSSLTAQQPQGKSGAGTTPPGWTMKMDPKDATKTAKFVTMGPGFHVTSGGAAIYYNPADVQGKDNFTVSANFRQTKKAEHPEAYGLIAGGQNLDDPAKQAYYYFVVRQDGSFLINHRAGAEVHKLVDWKPNAAIVKFDDKPNASNDLAIRVGSDSVRFLVNNKPVHAISRTQITDASGMVGLRVNHELDVHVANYTVTKGTK
ncbi:MAG TPA: hypothetical protein VIP11_12215 [Gemmatimonadaceae bacterium]